jgi:hypothetical protein
MTMYHDRFQGFILFRRYKRTWSFPKEIERIVMDETSDGSVLHFYGGNAQFGTRLDMDPKSYPHVIGNALYPPFKCKSFDYVVMDPPYTDLKAGISMSIMAPAACIARRKVFWLHTHWPLRNGLGLRLNRWWVASGCSMGAPMRILVEYNVVKHPNTCVGWPRRGRKRLNGSLGIYDWTRHVPNPRKYPQMVWQQKLPL